MGDMRGVNFLSGRKSDMFPSQIFSPSYPLGIAYARIGGQIHRRTFIQVFVIEHTKSSLLLKIDSGPVNSSSIDLLRDFRDSGRFRLPVNDIRRRSPAGHRERNDVFPKSCPE